MTLANSAVGLPTTKMTANRYFMDLIEDSTLQFFIMRNYDTTCEVSVASVR